MLALLLLCAASQNKCPKVRSNGPVTHTIAKLGQSSRGFADIVGYKTNATFPGVQENADLYMPYIYSVAGFGIPFLVLAILLILYFIVGCICSVCPCCWSKPGKPLGLVQIVLHIVLIVGLLISAAFFYVSAGMIANSLDDVKSFISGTSNTVNTVKNVVFGLVDDAESLIKGTINSSNDFINEFINFGETTFGNMETSAGQIVTKLDQFEAAFNAGGSYHSTANTFDGDYNGMYGFCYDDLSISPKPPKLADVGTAVGTGIANIKTATTSLTQMGTEMDTAISQMKTFKNDVFDDLEQQVDDLIENQIDPVKDQVSDIPKKIDEIMAPISKIIATAKSYSAPVTFVSASVIAVVTILYGILFFCNNKLAAGVLCSFWIVGLLLTVIIVVPSAVFAVLFYPLYDICPQIEDIAAGVAGDSFNFSVPLKDILMCNVSDADSSLYKLLELQNMFDYVQVLNDYKSQVASYTQGSLDYNSIKPQVDQILTLNIAEDFQRDKILGADKDPALIFNLYKQLTQQSYALTSPSAGCNTARTSLGNSASVFTKIDAVEDTMDTLFNDIETVKNDVADIRSFASQIEPKFTESNEILNDLVDDLFASALTLFDNGVQNLNCTLVCNIYAPAKNALCSSLLDGISFWILSSMLMILCISVLSITLCRRRRAMGGNRVYSKSSSSSYSSDRDLMIDRGDEKFSRHSPYNV